MTAIFHNKGGISGVLDAPEDVGVYEQLFDRLLAVAFAGDDARRELMRIRTDYQLLGG
jgi:hypothetical protein